MTVLLSPKTEILPEKGPKRATIMVKGRRRATKILKFSFGAFYFFTQNRLRLGILSVYRQG